MIRLVVAVRYDQHGTPRSHSFPSCADPALVHDDTGTREHSSGVGAPYSRAML
jgi:hypothetical protein